MVEEGRKAKEAEKKLREAEIRQEAKEYIRKAEKGGVELSEEEAIALARKRKRREDLKRKFQKAKEFADKFSEEFGSEKGSGKSGKSKRSEKSKKKRRTKQESKKKASARDLLIGDLEELGFRRRGGGLDLW